MTDKASRLSVVPLTSQAFAPYGDVIQVNDAARHFAINNGTTMRYHDLAQLEPGDGKMIVSVFRGQPRQLPYQIRMMERHPLGSQAFVPLSGKPYLLAVAVATSQPRLEDVQVFYARADQGINYATGVWHHPLMALEQTCDFLVIDRAGEGNNCEEAVLDQAGVVEMVEGIL